MMRCWTFGWEAGDDDQRMIGYCRRDSVIAWMAGGDHALNIDIDIIIIIIINISFITFLMVIVESNVLLPYRVEYLPGSCDIDLQ